MSSLVFNGDNISVKRESRRLILSRKNRETDSEETLTAPMHDIDRVTVVGHPSIPVSVFQTFMKDGIPVSFISEKGRWYGTLFSDGDKNARRRLRQYQIHYSYDPRLSFAKKLIYSKIRNQRRVLQRLAANRKLTEEDEHKSAMRILRTSSRNVESVQSAEELLGVEGYAAAVYFKRLARFFPENFPFQNRNRRPPRDAANAMLSWTYSIVLSEIETAVKVQGLDSCIGFFHEITPGKPSLSLDLLEPLRAPVCDLLVLNILNHRIMNEKDFRQGDNGGIYINEEGRKKFFQQYEPHMQRAFKMQGRSEVTDFRKEITQQVWNVLRFLGSSELIPPDFFQMP